MGIFQHGKALLIADMIPPVIFLRREKAAKANPFLVNVAIAQARGFRNDFLFCHLLFSISVIDKSAVNSPPNPRFGAVPASNPGWYRNRYPAANQTTNQVEIPLPVPS